MKSTLPVALLAASAFAVACSGETIDYTVTPTATFTGGFSATVNVSVIASSSPADGGVRLDIGPASTAYPQGFWYSSYVIFLGPGFETNTFTEGDVMAAFSSATPDGGRDAIGWTQQYQAFGGPHRGTFSLTITSLGPYSGFQWMNPTGQFTATLEPPIAPDAGPFPGPVMVKVTF